MTYRQLFDEAIGEPPPSSVDVGRVVAREGRLARVRRSGAVGIAALAVLASSFGIGALRDDLPLTGPAAAASASPSDQQRLTDAMLAALDREAPGLAWVKDANHLRKTFNGPTTTEPNLNVHQFEDLSASGWTGWAIAARDDLRAMIRIEVSTPKAGVDYARPCEENATGCTNSTGPNGERIRSDTSHGFYTEPTRPQERRPIRLNVAVVRPDGTAVSVQVMGTSDESPLSTEQSTRIALTPALSL